MQILENVGNSKTGKIKKGDTEIILMVSYKEAKIIYEAFEEYTKNNKRKVNAKKMYNQMYHNLPF